MTEELRRLGNEMLVAFAEGVVWSPDQRAAYEAFAAALQSVPEVAGEANGCEMPEVAAMRYIEKLRVDEGDSVTILCDDPEAATTDKRLAVECNGGWTDWRNVRFYGESVLQCLAKAICARDAGDLSDGVNMGDAAQLAPGADMDKDQVTRRIMQAIDLARDERAEYGFAEKRRIAENAAQDIVTLLDAAQPSIREQAIEDADPVMGTRADAEREFLGRVDAWAAERQPSMDTAAGHKKREAREREAGFRLLNAAALLAWHMRRSLGSNRGEVGK